MEADNEAYLNASAPLNALSELLPTLLAVIILVSGIILALILTLISGWDYLVKCKDLLSDM